MPPRRVTLSTVGLVPMIDRLATEPLMPNLAISLHATTEEQRAAIVPPSRKYGLHAIIEACRRFPLGKRSRITFEYVCSSGVNDTPADARRLARLLAGVKAKVNLIPLNAAPGIPFERPSDGPWMRFARILSEKGVTVSVRKSRGRDIRAACGQLIVEGGRKASAGAGPGGGARMTRPAVGHAPARWLAVAWLVARLRRRAAEPEGAAQAGRRDRRSRREERRHRALHRRAAAATPIVEQNARLVFFVQDVDGKTPAHRRRLQRLGDDAAGLRRQGRHADPHRRHARGRTSRARRSPTPGSNTCCSSRRRPGPTRRTRTRCARSPGPAPRCGCRSGRRPPRWKARPRYPRARSRRRLSRARALKGIAPRVDLSAGRLRRVSRTSTRRSTSSTAATTPTGCRCPSVLDQLIAAKTIPPIIAVFVEPGSRQEEYSRNPAWRTFMTKELVPAIDKRHRTFPAPDHRVIFGSSLGAYGAVDLAVETSRRVRAVRGDCAAGAGLDAADQPGRRACGRSRACASSCSARSTTPTSRARGRCGARWTRRAPTSPTWRCRRATPPRPSAAASTTR